MTSRATAVGIVALLVGAAVLVLTDGVPATLLGVLLLVPGAVVTTVAGLRGVHDSPEASHRADVADRRRDSGTSAQLKRASETGRWPRVIGGG